MCGGGGDINPIKGTLAIGEASLNAVKKPLEDLFVVPGQRSAEAQGNIAAAQLAEQREQRRLAMAAAEPTPQELASLEKAISLNDQDITRKQRLIDSSDPALIEAGKQALELLQGKESAVLSPIRRQREKEKQRLEETLRQRLGAGYAESTAGIQALSAFDEATANALAGAQQNTLNQLLGTSERTSSGFGLQNNIANQGAFSNILGNFQGRRVNAITGNPITAAGSQFVGDLATAQQNQALAGSLLNLAGTLGGAYLGGPAGAAAGSTATKPQTSYDFSNTSGTRAGGRYFAQS